MNIHPLPEAPFRVIFSPKEEPFTYGDHRSGLQQATLDAFNRWISPLTWVNAKGELQELGSSDEEPIRLEVNLRWAVADFLLLLPAVRLHQLHDIQMPDPRHFRLQVRRGDGLNFADAIIFKDHRFLLESVACRSQSVAA